MIIARIAEENAGLRRSERKVAELVLQRPNVVAESSIAFLAARAGVSEPTVIRFCRSLGCSGYLDFKRRLIKDLQRRTPVARPSTAAPKAAASPSEAARRAGIIAAARAVARADATRELHPGPDADAALAEAVDALVARIGDGRSGLTAAS